ncbi:MAG: hypothetical protein OEV00_09765, partial [Acidobacteriota bacterium]|nr:hypothetical protein [Acidobacteriota bacterium]
RFEIGRVDLHFRQMLRQYDYRFDTSTADNSGLTSGNFARLDMYNRLQDDRGETDLSTLTVSAPLGQRAHVSASVFGTFLGDETLTSDATFNAEGSASVGVCSISGTVCSGVMPCDTGIPGNICIPDAYSVTDGTNQADIEADFLVLDVDFSVQLKDGLDLHLQGRTLERDVQSTHVRDLDGNGVADDLEGTVQDTVAGSITSVDYSLDTLTALFDYRPSDRYRFRFGYRTINRELEREGFEFGTNDARNTPFESDSDGTVILGATLQPSDWFRLDANYEEGDITQAFTAVAPMETNRVRVRARFTPQPDLRIDVRYSGYENTNLGIDFRQADDCTTPGADIESGCWTGRAEGTTYSGRVWHRPSSALDYWFSWSQNDVDSAFRIRFDTEVFFNSAENGDSIYDSQSTELAAQVNINWSDQWKLFFRTSMNDASGHNRIAGVTFSNNIDIMQDYSDFEVGLTHTFDNGVYVGGRLRMFDYNDVNDRMDYDGDIFALTAGLRF